MKRVLTVLLSIVSLSAFCQSDTLEIYNNLRVYKEIIVDDGITTDSMITTNDVFQMRGGNPGTGRVAVAADEVGTLRWSPAALCEGCFWDSTGTSGNVHTIDIGWDVGIGIVSPSHKLHIQDSNATNGELVLIRNATSAGNGAYVKHEVNGTGNWRYGMPDNVDAFSIEDGFASRLYIDNAGDVGIGTTLPGTRLDVDGDYELTHVNGTQTLLVRGITSGPTTQLTLSGANSSSGATASWNISPIGTMAGVVGDGTDQTTYTLNPNFMDITPSNAAAVALRVGGAAMRLSTGDSSARPVGNQAGDIRMNTASDLVEFNDGTQWVSVGGNDGDWQVNLAQNMFNLNTGNVGIGTTSPASKLDVLGTFDLNFENTTDTLFVRRESFGLSQGVRVSSKKLNQYANLDIAPGSVRIRSEDTGTPAEAVEWQFGPGGLLMLYPLGTPASSGPIANFNTTNSIRVPQGTTAERPTGSNGQIRFNTTENELEYAAGTNWITIPPPPRLKDTLIFRNFGAISLAAGDTTFYNTFDNSTVILGIRAVVTSSLSTTGDENLVVGIEVDAPAIFDAPTGTYNSSPQDNLQTDLTTGSRRFFISNTGTINSINSGVALFYIQYVN